MRTNCWTIPAGERSLSNITPRSIPRLERSIVRSRGEAAGKKEVEDPLLEDSAGAELCLGEFWEMESVVVGEGSAKAVAVRQVQRNKLCRNNII